MTNSDNIFRDKVMLLLDLTPNDTDYAALSAIVLLKGQAEIGNELEKRRNERWDTVAKALKNYPDSAARNSTEDTIKMRFRDMH